jgi:hypothetical protein
MVVHVRPTSGYIVIITLINVEEDPGEYMGAMFACGPINKIYSHILIQCAKNKTYVVMSQLSHY